VQCINQSTTAAAYDWSNDDELQKLGSRSGIYTNVGDAAAYLVGLTGGRTVYSAYATPYTESTLIQFLLDGYPVARLYGWVTINVVTKTEYSSQTFLENALSCDYSSIQ